MLKVNFDRTHKMVLKNLRIASGYINPNNYFVEGGGPKVLINSVPKSGTNMLQEAVQLMPGIRGTFKRTIYGFPDEANLEFVKRMRSGTCSTAHLFYSHQLEKTTSEEGVVVVHVVRDFRDSLLSQMSYMEKLGASHRHGALLQNIESFDEKLDICLYGVPGVFKGWIEILPKFDGWKNSNALILKYEDVFSEIGQYSNSGHLKSLNLVARTIGVDKLDSDVIVAGLKNENSLTYNSPGINKWKKVLTNSQLNLVNDVLGKHLELFDYEI